jgi:tRNA(Ile)-lysidine synthase
MPELKEINDRAVDHIVDIALDSVRLRDDISAEIESSECLKCSEGESILNVERLLKLGQMAQGECILKALENVCGRRKDISREHIEAVQNLAGLETGKSVDLIYRMKAVKSYDEIIITKSEGSDPRNGSQEAPEQGLGEIETEVIDYSDELEISKKEYTKMVDYDKIKNALVLRTPMPEDYIVINSTGGQKKLSRFLSHSKIEQAKRTHFPVVADGNEIVWAIGLRLSERYKVTSETRKVMVITYKKR